MIRCSCLNAMGFSYRLLNGNLECTGIPAAQAILTAVNLIPDDFDTFLVTDLNDVPGLKAALTGGQWAALVQFKNDTVKAKRRELTGTASWGLVEEFMEKAHEILSAGQTLTQTTMATWLNDYEDMLEEYPDQEV